MDAKYVIDLLRKDAEMFSYCHHSPDNCPHCFHARMYIEHFFEKNPELKEI
jgi:hypothetical protein